MLGNDLSNQVASRLLFVFEDTLGIPPAKEDVRKESIQRRLKRWDKVVSYWDISDYAVAHLWDLTTRYDYRCDVATFQPKGFARALQDRFDDENIPAKVRTYTDAADLGRKLARQVDIARVYDARPDRVLFYGSRGTLFTTTNWNPLA